MTFDRPLPIIAALIALVLGASVAGFLLRKRQAGYAVVEATPAQS